MAFPNVPIFSHAPKMYVWVLQPLASLWQFPPVQNTWYEILAETENVKVYWAITRQLNDETVAKDVEVKVTTADVTLEGSQSQNHNDFYYWQHAAYTDALACSGTTESELMRKKELESSSVKVEVRTTSALGTNPKLAGYLIYAIKKRAA